MYGYAGRILHADLTIGKIGGTGLGMLLWLDHSKQVGKSPADTEDAIREEFGDYYIRVAAIGPAGEKLVRIACIINDKTRTA